MKTASMIECRTDIEPIRIRSVEPARDEQRSAERIITLYRLACITTGSDSGLARVRNISDDGMMLFAAVAVEEGDIVAITLSDTIRLTGTVLWTAESRFGIGFAERIDAAALLQHLADERKRGRLRSPRLATDSIAVATTEAGMQVVRVVNMSPMGMRIVHGGKLGAGCVIRVRLENGTQGRGIVRWSEDRSAGIQLLEPLSYEQLQSANAI